jgi:hypothetical protein
MGRTRDFTDRLAGRFVGDHELHRRNVDSIATYFGTDARSAFDGSRFETYGGANDPSHVTAADLVAVTMLSMEIRRESRSGISTWNARCLEDKADDIRALLEVIPDDIDLHELSSDEYAQFIGDGSPGDQLWRCLRDEIGMHRVAAFKLMARKRPRLFPIKDSRTVKALGNQPDWWRSWYEALRQRGDVVNELEEIRRDAPLAGHLSILRIADIVLWSP